MYRTRFLLNGLLLVLVALAVASADAQTTKDKKKTLAGEADKASLWMTKKLEFSQKILMGLTKGDFDLVTKNAEAMLVVGYLEKWDRAGMPEYRRQIRYFDEANKELIRQAEKKNIHGATLAYTQLTLSCVHCHTIIRDAKTR